MPSVALNLRLCTGLVPQAKHRPASNTCTHGTVPRGRMNSFLHVHPPPELEEGKLGAARTLVRPGRFTMVVSCGIPRLSARLIDACSSALRRPATMGAL